MSTAKTKDEQIEQLIKVVLQKKEAIKAANQKYSPATNSSFSFGDNLRGNFNILTQSDVNKFVEALAFLLNLQNAHAEACERLGVTTEFKWQGYTVAEWEADFKARLNKVQVKANEAELETYEKALNKLISKEKREEMELAELTKKILG
jgi:hypothetical protein